MSFCCGNDAVDAKKQDDKISNKRSLFGKYQQLLVRYPYAANATQGAIITAGGVMSSNYISNGSVDWMDVLVMAIVSCTLITPALLVFYSFLGKIQVSKLGKLFIDQALFSPLFTACIISYKLVLMSHGKITLDELLKTLLAVLPNACVASWCFWIPQRYFTLTFVDEHLHVVFGSLCSFFWQMIFTVVTRGPQPHGSGQGAEL